MPEVAVILGSKSDLETVEGSKLPIVFRTIDIDWELSVISAHRNPAELHHYCIEAVENHGVKVFIGIAGMTPALPGAIAGIMIGQVGLPRPVIGVALSSSTVNARDTESAITRMPPGVPVACPGADKVGLHNAALLAVQMLAMGDVGLARQLKLYLEENHKQAELGLPISNQGD